MALETEATSQSNICPIDTLIDNLLSERNEMLVLFCKLAGLEPFHHDKPVGQELEEFCEILMDYISAGHFEAYERILKEESPNHQAVIDLARKIYPQILETTDHALAFNDKYVDDNALTNHMGELSGDLSRLIGEMANRIDLEDRLINALRGVK